VLAADGLSDSSGYNGSMVVSEGMELVIMFFVILLNLLILVWLQKWSGLT
jgi:hypothetical protein